MIRCLSRHSALFAMALAVGLAQVDTGTISGIVSDSSGAMVPGATVVVTQQETNVRMTLTTNDAGFYSAPSLRPGHYDVSVSKAGFQSQRKTGTRTARSGPAGTQFRPGGRRRLHRNHGSRRRLRCSSPKRRPWAR